MPNISLPFTNIRQVLSLHNKVSPEKIFLTVISDQGREELSYGEFSARCHQTANFLQEDLGIQPGDVVAILEEQSRDGAVLIMACWLIGAVAALLDPLPSDSAFQNLILSGAKIVLLHARFLPGWNTFIRDGSDAQRQVWNALTIIQVGLEPQASYPHFNTLVRSMPNTFFNEFVEPKLNSQAILLLNQSEKLLEARTQGELLTAAQHLANTQMINGNHRLINTVQLRPSFAIEILLTTLLVGGSLIVAPVFLLDERAFWYEVAALRLHIACLADSHLENLITFAREQKAAGKPIYGTGIYQQDIQQLRHIYCPDAKGRDDLIQEFTNMFPFPVITDNQ